MASNIIEYITKELHGIADPEEKKQALVSIVSVMMDKGLLDFPDGTAGYLDNLEAITEADLAEVNRIIDNNGTVRAWRDKAEEEKQAYNRGGYESLIVPVDNATRKIFEGMKLNKETPVTAISATKADDRKKKVVTVLLRNQSKFSDIISRLNEDDKRTFVAIANLIKEGTLQVTPIQLYRKAHLDKNIHPTEEQLARQDESIRKMARIYLKLDTKEILAIYPELERIPIGANFIDIKEYYGRTANGSFSEYYEFTGIPILFEYSMILKQVETIQSGERSVFISCLRKTRENEIIIQVIGDRALALKGNGRVNKKITYERLFAGVDFSKCKSDQAKYNKRSRKKKDVAKHLKFLEEANLINGFEELEDGIEIY